MKRLMVIVLAVFSAGAFTACGGKKTEQFNLLVITLDTTRADGIGAYGNRDASTPHIDRLAETASCSRIATRRSP
jgi:hypothetical protein